MIFDLVFSWAQHVDGGMVYVDDVPKGLACNCICPHCKERLLARHGTERAHHFAHFSKNRQAKLEICYMVILYKLAEQIILKKKRIHAPSYYGIFKEDDLFFEDVKVDCSYERKDKQPDVIATTHDGKQYLIEFIFQYKVQHKKSIDYKNMSCLEIDLSGQKLETLEDFLLNSSADRKWVNNENYFSRIESIYAQENKNIRIVNRLECAKCSFSNDCCGVKIKNSNRLLSIENNGCEYLLCKPDFLKQKQDELQRFREQQRIFQEDWERQKKNWEEDKQRKKEELRKRLKKHDEATIAERKMFENQQGQLDLFERTCFDCKSNLKWMNRNGYANCGRYISMNVPKNTPPEVGRTCKGFVSKTSF